MRKLHLFYMLTLLSFLIGPLEASAESPVVIKVKQGDTLSQLCEKYLDDPKNWPQIAKLNRLSNPNQIFPSEYLIIPVDLLKGIPVKGKITHIQGKVELLPSTSRDKWLPVALNDLIEQGQKIRTSAESSVEISYPDDVFLFLRENTMVRVVKTREKSKINKAYDFFLDIGRSTSKIRKATGKKNKYQIRTPTAVAGARGTNYRVNVDSEKNTRLEVLEGMVDVNAGKHSMQVASGYGTIVSKNQKRNKIVKLLPPSPPANLLQLYRSMPLQFSFTPVNDAQHLRVYLARDKKMQDIVKEKQIKPTEIFGIVSVEDGKYYLACSSVDALGIEGPFPEPIQIQVRINPLPPFVQSPENNAEIKEKYCSLNWLQVSDAIAYHVQIAQDIKFETIIQEDKQLKNTSITTNQLAYNTYFYRISSIAADGYKGVWSDTNSFSLIPPPAIPKTQEPSISNNEIKIRWQNVGENITYRFQLSQTPDFTTLLEDQKTSEPQISLTRPEESGTYYSRIQAIDGDGYESNFSAPQSFDIEYELSWLDGSLIMSYLLALVLIF